MSFTANVANYISSAKYAAVTAWAVGTAKTVGNLVRQSGTPTVGDERIFVCIVAGTTHATTQPTWVITRGDKTTDNTVTWQEITGIAAVNGDLTNTPTWLLGAKNVNNSLGHVIKDAAGTHLFICTTAGNGGNGAEPTWNTAALGNTTTDSSAVWTYIGTGFSAWAGPHARIRNSQQTNWGTNGGAANDPTKYYVGSDHAETQASGITWTSRGTLIAPIDILCVNVAGSLPPVAADLAATGTVTATGSNSITLNGQLRVCYGLSFIAGTSGNISIDFLGETLVDKNYENCKFTLGSGAGAGSQFHFGNGMGRMTYRGCTFKFSATGQGFGNGGLVRFIDCTIDGAGSIPSQFIQATANGSDFSFEACDLSALAASTIGGNNSGSCTGRYSFIDCKFPSSFTPWTFSGSNSDTGEQVTFSRCASSGLPLQFIYSERAGLLQSSTAVYRTSGAAENSQGFSWGITTTVNANLGSTFFEAPPVVINNSVTAADVIVTMRGIANAAAVPTNSDIWMDVFYLGAAGHTRASIISTRVADFIAAPANYTTDTASAWDTGATARQNSHAYAVGDILKVATNTGRIFFCTSAGTSAGTEPGGYASAVDGGVVTDSGATFRAGFRFKMSVTLTSPQPALAGPLTAKLYAGKASTTYFIDPRIALS